MEGQGNIIILDCGGQYAHLIARRVRQLGVYSEIRAAETPASDLKGAAGIILSGGPVSVYEEGSPQGSTDIFELGIPILGICYGMQWMAHVLGGEVTAGKVKEYGRTEVREWGGRGMGSGEWGVGIPESFTVWMSHGDEVTKLPEGFTQLATSDACENAAMINEEKKFIALQFHPEVTHTEHGQEILKKFVDLCDVAPWSIKSYSNQIGDKIKKEVGDRNVFMLVSGGVDSTVAFTLLNKVLGANRVQGLLVDTGLMRKNEVSKITEAFDAMGITNLRVEHAEDEFLSNLKEVYDPEEKRKTIGDTFLDVQRRVSEEMDLKMEDGWMLGQGTIYPDTIETGGTKHADQIKTHHNRVEAIQKMIDAGLVIEPLIDLYKDEVRVLGEELGLPHELVWRHPFPGPGLGVRILCAKKPELGVGNGEWGIEVKSQALPVKSVGVQGDGRSYRHAVALFSDDPCDIPSDHWKLATEIPNATPDFNRVVQCLSHQSPVEIAFTRGYITPERADLAREADAIVDEEMKKAGLYESLWQFPVVLLPFGLKEGYQSVALRPVESLEAMTANSPHFEKGVLSAMTERILALEGIDMVFYDLTHKPPGTIEWE